MTFLHSTLNQATKFRTSNYQIGLKKNADARGTWSTNSGIKLKTTISKSNLCDYSNTYILFEGTTSVRRMGTAAAPNKRTKKGVLKNFDSFTDCISEPYLINFFN